MFTSTEFRSKFVETYYLKFVKLVARILGYMYNCEPLVPVLKYQYSYILNLVRYFLYTVCVHICMQKYG